MDGANPILTAYNHELALFEYFFKYILYTQYGVPVDIEHNSEITTNPCCKRKWCTVINPEEKKTNFESYSKLQGAAEKRKYLENLIHSRSPEYCIPRCTKKPNHFFFLFVNSQKVRVCKKKLRSVLRISDWKIRVAISKMEANFSTNNNTETHALKDV